jgi:hypothetical protein
MRTKLIRGQKNADLEMMAILLMQSQPDKAFQIDIL